MDADTTPIVVPAPTGVGPSQARWDAKDGWNLLGSLRAVERFLRKATIHAEAGHGGYAELEAMAEIVRMSQHMLDTAIRAELANGSDFRDIAGRIGRHQQSVARTYKGVSVRARGGQLAGDR